ncbi:hypothetical protein BN59_03199 [Legionella massiliensis]|uniref:Uncharacterized protein n=1 Tax=Legionella massiliensis TaxID=1034943 RepID=A0A078L430_9GAMM|nr:hypothetical protein [Legionella massiliensis]CDZ78884.1 hypothetical protein BN59_03199 [Legionella massiliensis]CEE14622.1 hypothetical protein BN1094_03199 [Legionella massiliensis]
MPDNETLPDSSHPPTNPLHVLVKEDFNELRAVLNSPDFNRAWLEEKDSDGNTPMDILEQSEGTAPEKFMKRYSLMLSGAGINIPDSLDISQARLNRQISNRLLQKDRDVSFFNAEGLCNGYSFLHNYYSETRGEDYFYTSLMLISLWDGTNASLKQPLPAFLPQSAEYKNLDELFEQWSNDLFLFFGSAAMRQVFPKMEQVLEGLS